MVVVGVVAMVLSMLIPVFAGARLAARNAVGVASIRQIGLGLMMHANDNDDRPPAVFSPVYRPSGDTLETVRLRGLELTGSWWSNDHVFHLALDDPLPAELLVPPGVGYELPVVVNGVETNRVSWFHLSETLFASPEFFTRDADRGPRQWGVQRFTRIAAPSDKALIAQAAVFGAPGLPRGAPACCVHDAESPVLWADLSAQAVVQGDLRPGVPNPFKPDAQAALPWQPGLPIHETEHGVEGRDRP